jgi:hypothetical protein
VTASEFAFLSLGLVLGALVGAALVEILRSRPIAQHEVRVTVAPDSVARRRSVTLSEDVFWGAATGAAAGGPADHGEAIAAWPGTRPDPNDRSPLPPVGAGDPGSGAPRAAAAGRTAAADGVASGAVQRPAPSGTRPAARGQPASTLASRALTTDSTGRPVMAMDVGAGMDEMLASLRRASTGAAASAETTSGGRRRRSSGPAEAGSPGPSRRRVSTGAARTAEGPA